MNLHSLAQLFQIIYIRGTYLAQFFDFILV